MRVAAAAQRAGADSAALVAIVKAIAPGIANSDEMIYEDAKSSLLPQELETVLREISMCKFQPW